MAIGASGLCLVHCLALPVIIAALPVASGLSAASEALHIWILAFAVPTSLIALGFGAKQSGQWGLVAGGVVGLSLLFFGLWFEDISSLAVMFTIAGSALLVLSHLLNWRMRRSVTKPS